MRMAEVDIPDYDRPSPSLLLQRNYSVNYQPITLSWRNIHVHVQPRRSLLDRLRKIPPEPPRQILKDVSGCVKPGTLLAIMAASGAGKSTLLNVLNQRNIAGLEIEGDIEVNGSKLSRAAFTAMSAYVQQDDMFIGLLTVREHLWFQSKLRMDKHVTEEMRAQRVEEVIQELGLTSCADTMIGAPGVKKSISGGEKKRLAFASEILTNPPLLFCDEPTSGLDSFMAESVAQTMKNLAARGKTIIATIHQPSSEVYAMFDTLLLIADGRVAYMGPAKEAAPFFQKVGYRCPEAYNPADFFIHTLAVAPGREEESKENIKMICEKFDESVEFDKMKRYIGFLAAHPSSLEIETRIDDNASPYKTPWTKQFPVVLWRSWVSGVRQPIATRVRIIQTLFVGLLFGFIFFQQEYNQKGVMNINGVLFLLQTQVSFGNVFSVVNTFPLEFPVFMREHHSGMYRVIVYFISKMLAELPLAVFVPLLISVITYWMIGLNPDPSAFLVLAATLTLMGNVAISYGYVIGCSTSSVSLATAIMPTVLIPLLLFGGFFLNSESVPLYLTWLQYLSWFNYGNEILLVNQWSTITNITCEYVVPGNLGNMTTGVSSRCFTDGQQIIEGFSFKEGDVLTDAMAMIGLMIGFRIISFCIMLFRCYKKH